MDKTFPLRFVRLLASALLGLAAALLWLGLLTPPPAVGAQALGAPAAGLTFTVTNNGDFPDATPGDGVCETLPHNGICTLRAAVQEADAHPGADTILLQAHTPYLLTRQGVDDTALNGDLDITDSVTLLGAGPDSTIIDGASLNERLFQITGTVTISGVTLQNGHETNFGGGVLNNGWLTFVNSHIVSNTVSGVNDWGGGIATFGWLTLTHSLVSGNATGNHNAYGGGIANNGIGLVTLIDSTVSNNVTVAHASAPFSPGFGGGIYGAAQLLNSTVSGNTGFLGGGLYAPGSPMTLTNSTISGNTSVTSGGGLYSASGTLTLINSTVSGNNSAVSGGGFYVNAGLTQLFNTTVTQNRANADGVGAGFGGGVANHAGATFTFANTILAGNTSVEVTGQGLILNDDDCLGQLVSAGNNLMGPFGAVNCTGVSQVPQADPALGPLQANGGPTFTHALLPGSPALDAGNPGGCTDNVGAPLATDQRGQRRTANGAGLTRCDIGAYELQRVLDLPLVRR